MSFRFPSERQRVLSVGRTGSGKTQAAAWLLSEAHFDKQPYIIFDYKLDELLNASDLIKEIGVEEKLPTAPGIYIVHPLPEIDDERAEQMLMRIWKQENVGVYIDEGYMLPQKAGLRAILTQGRSKKIPVIMLSQRPSQILRFCVSESDYFMIFHQNDRRDQKCINEFTPKGFAYTEVPEYHSKWYDVSANKSFLLKPVPKAEAILDRIEDRLKPAKNRRVI